MSQLGGTLSQQPGMSLGNTLGGISNWQAGGPSGSAWSLDLAWLGQQGLDLDAPSIPVTQGLLPGALGECFGIVPLSASEGGPSLTVSTTSTDPMAARGMGGGQVPEPSTSIPPPNADTTRDAHHASHYEQQVAIQQQEQQQPPAPVQPGQVLTGQQGGLLGGGGAGPPGQQQQQQLGLAGMGLQLPQGLGGLSQGLLPQMQAMQQGFGMPMFGGQTFPTLFQGPDGLTYALPGPSGGMNMGALGLQALLPQQLSTDFNMQLAAGFGGMMNPLQQQLQMLQHQAQFAALQQQAQQQATAAHQQQQAQMQQLQQFQTQLHLLQQQQQQQQQQQHGQQGQAQHSIAADGSHHLSEDEDANTRALKRQRLVWTPQLHKSFEEAVEKLGEKAVPKNIMREMNVDGLTRENVASHLQKFRMKQMKGPELPMPGSGQEGAPTAQPAPAQQQHVLQPAHGST